MPNDSMPNDNMDAAFDELFSRAKAAKNTTKDKGPLDPDYIWPEAEPFNTVKPAHDFPLTALPPLIRNAVRETQALTLAPPAMVAGSAIAAAGLAAQGHANVARDTALVGPLSVFLLAIAESGERKTAVDGKLWQGAREASDQLHQRREQEIKQAQAQLELWETLLIELKSERKKVMKTGKASAFWTAEFHAKRTQLVPDAAPPPMAALDLQRAMLQFLATQLENHLDNKPIIPAPINLLRADDTTEALAKALSQGWPVAAIAEDEGGIVLGNIAITKEKVLGTFAIWNKFWGGTGLDQDRVSVEARHVRDVRVGFNLMIQPEVLTRVLNENHGLARVIGLQARYLTCWPTSTMGQRRYRRVPEVPQGLIDFNARCYELLVNVALPYRKRPNGTVDPMRLDPPILPLSADAHARWVVYHDAVERELLGQFDDIRDVAAKAAEQAVRLAAVFWVFEHGHGPGPGDAIDDMTMHAALRVSGWFLLETQRVLRAFDRSAPEQRAETLLSWLASHQLASGQLAAGQSWTLLNDILRLGPAEVRKRDDRDLALALLKDRGLVATDTNGRRERVVVLHPSVRRRVPE
jgi:putative DNA primase/helicase